MDFLWYMYVGPYMARKMFSYFLSCLRSQFRSPLNGEGPGEILSSEVCHFFQSFLAKGNKQEVTKNVTFAKRREKY